MGEQNCYVERRVQGIRYEVRSNVVGPNHGCTKKKKTTAVNHFVTTEERTG